LRDNQVIGDQWLEHKTVEVDGINVHYIKSGEGPVVLLLHGLGTSLITWSRNIKPLTDAGYTVVAPDLPGHGDSDKPKSLKYDPPAGARLIHRFLRALEIQRLSMVGSSAGGLVAALFTLDYPEKVERLVLVASGGLGRRISWILRMMSLPVLGEVLYQPWVHEKFDVSKWIFYRPPPFLSEILPEMARVRALPGSRRAVLRSIRSSINFRGLRKRHFILNRLQQCTVPMMTVWGEEDIILPVSHATAMQEALPHSVVRTIPECGHWPHMEKADEFNDLLARFLRGSLDHQPAPNCP